MRGVVLAVLTVFFLASAWAEDALPPLPVERDLIAFRVGAQPPDRFLIDTHSLKVDKEGTIDYVLVTRGNSALNMSLESLHCGRGEYKLRGYAGRNDSDWRLLNSGWRALDGRSAYVGFGYSGNDPRGALAQNLFCDGSASFSKEEILSRLRGHSVDFMDPSHF